MKSLFYLLLTAFLSFSCGSDSAIETSGTLEGKDIAISSQVVGVILKINSQEGTYVKKGATILTIDSTEYVLQLKQAEALLAQAKGQYELAKKGARSEDVSSAKEAVETAKANAESAKKDYDRFSELYKTNSITSKAYDDAKTRFVMADGQYKQVLENYKKLTTGSRPEELEIAKGRYEQALAQVNLMKKKTADCLIKAVSDGYLTKISVEEGELVNMGAQVARLTDLSEMTMKIYVKETELGLVKLGLPVSVFVDSFPDSALNGKVTYISNSAEFTPKNIQSKDDRVKLVYEVKLSLPNPNQQLKAGMIGDVRI